MPLYEYECEHGCKANGAPLRLELVRKFSDTFAILCPACDGEMRRLISKNSFQLKGGGWARDAYSKRPVSNE